ncbi:MAG: hypothetical protein NVS3B17_14990 [Vulcanimicrobiaceae bacterium]
MALATFFVVVQFYTSLASLAPTPPVGYVFASPLAAGGLVAALVLAAAASLVRLVRDRARPDPASAALLAAWLGSATLSSALGLDPFAGLQVVAMMAMCAIVHVALERYLREDRVRSLVLGAYLGTGTLATLAALGMFLLRRPAALWVFNNGRAAGVFVTANQFAAYLIALLFVAFGVALGRSGWLRRLGWLTVALAAVGLVTTVSQAGWLGAAAGAAFFAIAAGARRAAIGIGCAAAILALVIVARPVARHDPAEAFDRVRIWTSGARVVQLFPLTGVGPMAYWRVYPAVAPPNADRPGTFGALHPHDVYLSLAGETGAVGMAAFGYGWWRFARTFRARLRASGPRERQLGLGIAAALVAVLVHGFFDTVGIVEMTFVWIPFTALALGCVAPPRGGGAP